MTQRLYLIRGLPGSGKSTFAKELSDRINDAHVMASVCAIPGPEYPMCNHLEADMYFIDLVGSVGGRDIHEYRFDATRLGDAHRWCKNMTNDSLTVGFSVVVSNTFSTMWEMKPYVEMARESSIPVTVLTCEGNYGSIHDVPEEVIEKMRRRWEPFTL